MSTSAGMRQMPVYQCHKKVWALKIKEISRQRRQKQMLEWIMLLRRRPLTRKRPFSFQKMSSTRQFSQRENTCANTIQKPAGTTSFTQTATSHGRQRRLSKRDMHGLGEMLRRLTLIAVFILAVAGCAERKPVSYRFQGCNLASDGVQHCDQCKEIAFDVKARTRVFRCGE